MNTTMRCSLAWERHSSKLTATLVALSMLCVPFIFPRVVTAQEAPDKKKILVLYKERDPNHENVVSYLTQFLEKAGLQWEAKDVETFFPSDPDMSPYHGIMTCYLSSQMVGADTYPLWMAKQLEAGRKVAIIGSYGAYQGLIPKPDGKFVEWNESTKTINTFMWPFGLEFYFAFTNDTSKFKITKKGGQFSEFQTPLKDSDINYYQLYKSRYPENNIYLSVERSDMFDSDSVFIAHTPFGGMILEGYGYFWDDKKKAMIQRTDMVSFLEACFEGKSPPVPHYDLMTHDQLKAENPIPERLPPVDPYRTNAAEVKRWVLVLYKKSEAKTLEDLPVYDRADIVLTYLGLGVDYRAVEDGLPTDSEMVRYRGIITWFATPHMVNAKAYSDWLVHQIKQGRKLVIFEDYGAGIDMKEQIPTTNARDVFDALGIDFTRLPPTGGVTKHPSIRLMDPQMIGFEHKVSMEDINYQYRYASIDERNHVYLSAQDPDVGAVDLVITTPYGGTAMGSSPFYFPPGDVEHMKVIEQALAGEIQPELAEEKTLGNWIINPYKFLAESLDTDELPAPDYTTMNGARLFYAHIDGDGLDSVSLIDRAHMAGVYIEEFVLKAYPQVPQGVSVISKFVERAGNRYYHPSVDLARSIFRLPQIEVASHAATHPFDWVGGDPYVINPNSYPYKVGYIPTDLAQECWATKLFIERNLAPPGKKCDVLYWSGATNPNIPALEAVWRAGLLNLNGGDPIYDSAHDSIAGLCPVSTPGGIGGTSPRTVYRQFHSSGQNDYLYTLFLTGDWAGQKKLVEHFKYTNEPYRILPMNLYYHFYSGIKNESLGALKYVLDSVIEMEAAMVFPSQYCRIAEDFYRTNIWLEGTRSSPACWMVENQGDLREIRFKRITHVDLLASQGVLGYSYFQGNTYVHLDGRPLRKIVLKDEPPQSPYVQRSTYSLDEGIVSATSLDLTARGLGRFAMVFGGLGTFSWHIVLKDQTAKTVFEQDLNGDAQGKAEMKVDLPAPEAAYNVSLQRS